MTVTTSFQGQSAIRRMGLAVINLHTKYLC